MECCTCGETATGRSPLTGAAFCSDTCYYADEAAPEMPVPVGINFPSFGRMKVLPGVKEALDRAVSMYKKGENQFAETTLETLVAKDLISTRVLIQWITKTELDAEKGANEKLQNELIQKVGRWRQSDTAAWTGGRSQGRLNEIRKNEVNLQAISAAFAAVKTQLERAVGVDMMSRDALTDWLQSTAGARSTAMITLPGSARDEFVAAAIAYVKKMDVEKEFAGGAARQARGRGGGGGGGADYFPNGAVAVFDDSGSDNDSDNDSDSDGNMSTGAFGFSSAEKKKAALKKWKFSVRNLVDEIVSTAKARGQNTVDAKTGAGGRLWHLLDENADVPALRAVARRRFIQRLQKTNPPLLADALKNFEL